MGINILSRRKSENNILAGGRLRAGEQKYHLAIKHIPGLVCRGYEDWSVDFIDNKVGELTGYDKKEFDARRLKWSDLIVKEDIEAVKESVSEAINTGNSYIREYRIKTKTGKILWMEDRGQIITNETGGLEYFSGVILDITKQKLAEEKLLQSEEKYRLLVNHASDAIFITQDDTIKFSNPKTAEISGYSAAELAQIPFVNFIHHEDRDMVIEQYRRSLKREKSADTISFRILNKAGKEIWVLPRTTAIVWDQRPASLIFLRDITALKQAEEERKQIEGQLVQSAKLSALGELTAGVSHELNQPLNGIKITSQSLLRDIKNNRLEEEELEEDLTEIVNQVNKMAEIIDHMRVYTRNTEGKPSERIDISTVIEGPFKILDQQLKTHGIEVIRDFATDLPQVTCDPIRLEQVFLNLINNARLALDGCGKENKRIEIRACESNDRQAVEVAVKDNGQGIAEHLRQKIFQPFFTTREPGKGTGLGLSVSHKIIEEHQGRIELESKVGEGTTFKVILPTGS